MSTRSRLIAWATAGVMAGGAALWALGKWLSSVAKTAGPVTKGVAATTAAVVGTATFTASFGDKTAPLAPYNRRVAQAVSKGSHADAGRIIDGLAAEVDAKLKSLPPPPPAPATAPGPNADPHATGTATGPTTGPFRAERAWERVQRTRRAIELVRANVRHASGQLPTDAWVQNYRDALSKDAEDARRLIDAVMAMEGDRTFPPEGVRKLLTTDVPAPVRARLALWLASQLRQDNRTLSDAECSLFGEILSGAHDTDAAGTLVETYVSEMGKRRAAGGGASVLAVAIALYPDSELGFAAAKWWVVEAADPRRTDMVAYLVETYPGTRAAAQFRDEYVVHAMAQREYDKALRLMDDGSIARAATLGEAAAAVVAAADRARALFRSPGAPGPATGGGTPATEQDPAATHAVPAGSPDPPHPTSLQICAVVAERALERGEPAFAAHLLYAALRAAGTLPPDTATGRTVTALADLGDVSDGGTATAVAGFLLAVTESQTGDNGAARNRAESLITRQGPPAIRGQLLVLAVQLALSGGDFDAASRFLQELSRSAPESPMLVRLSARLAAAREEAALRSRIDARVAERLKALDAAGSGAEAFAAADALSDLYLARGDVVQALGTYLRFVNHWPDHEKAPAMLSKAILLLPELGETAGSDRLQALASQLMSRYPDSPEASALKAKATTRN